VYELFASREYLRSYHTRLLPLNAFAGPLRRTGERIAPSLRYRMTPLLREKCCSLLVDIVI